MLGDAPIGCTPIAAPSVTLTLPATTSPPAAPVGWRAVAPPVSGWRPIPLTGS